MPVGPPPRICILMNGSYSNDVQVEGLLAASRAIQNERIQYRLQHHMTTANAYVFARHMTGTITKEEINNACDILGLCQLA